MALTCWVITPDGEGVGEGVGEGLGEGIGEGTGERLGEGIGEGIGERLGEGMGEGTGEGPEQHMEGTAVTPVVDPEQVPTKGAKAEELIPRVSPQKNAPHCFV